VWAGGEEVWPTGEEFKAPLFWKSRGRRSRHTPDDMDVSAAMEKVGSIYICAAETLIHKYFQMFIGTERRSRFRGVDILLMEVWRHFNKPSLYHSW